ncbi:hypothetical protein Dimus_026563 [Dionaea muscipula]
MAAVGDVEKMIAVGLVWGATNALMKKGALIWDKRLESSSLPEQSPSDQRPLSSRIITSLRLCFKLILTWQYSLPLSVNLAASVTFFSILGHAPISLAVPVTNATTFATTAVVGILLGEETRVGFALLYFLSFYIYISWILLRQKKLKMVIQPYTYVSGLYLFLKHS